MIFNYQNSSLFSHFIFFTINQFSLSFILPSFTSRTFFSLIFFFLMLICPYHTLQYVGSDVTLNIKTWFQYRNMFMLNMMMMMMMMIMVQSVSHFSLQTVSIIIFVIIVARKCWTDTAHLVLTTPVSLKDRQMFLPTVNKPWTSLF